MKTILLSLSLFLLSVIGFSNEAKAQTFTNDASCDLLVTIDYGPSCPQVTQTVLAGAQNFSFTAPPPCNTVVSVTINDGTNSYTFFPTMSATVPLCGATMIVDVDPATIWVH
ncbi:MAG: hypothetical protein EOP48_17365 [Sphingobacteriales bacterium]|nr:MAG: hypothetical protein EOP48_17365 [Sphingobacteriales bacterium]